MMSDNRKTSHDEIIEDRITQVEDRNPEKKQKISLSSWDEDKIYVEEKSSIALRPRTATQWDETPKQATSTSSSSQWDQTPISRVAPSRVNSMSTSATGATPSRRSRWDVTPVSQTGQQTPVHKMVPMTPDKIYQQSRFEQDILERNKPLTDEELDALFPSEGYTILKPPKNYVPMTPSKRYLLTPSSETSTVTSYYKLPTEKPIEEYGVPILPSSSQEYPDMKPEDIKYFSKLLEEVDEESLSKEELYERKILELLLHIKNGTPPLRKKAMKHITERARIFGAGPLFNQILPLMMSPTLQEFERHLLVKVIDRVLFKLDDLVRPFVQKILVVTAPMLIDEDYFVRIEGREVISNLAKAAGLPSMISNLRPDLDHPDEYVRNTTARAFSIVASALGVQAILPFLRAVCQSKKSWQARHTGIKVVQQIAILLGVGVLPYLKSLIEIISASLDDQEPKVKIITALTLSSLAETCSPYGIEAFDTVLKPLWIGIQKYKGKLLAAFLKAMGFIIPLMIPEHAAIYTRNIMDIVIREFSNRDDEMRKIIMKVCKQCVTTEGVEPKFIKEKMIIPFFSNYWERSMALDKRNYRQLMETTVTFAGSVGGALILEKIVKDLKDEAEPFRKMTIETIQQIIQQCGSADIQANLEVELVDGLLCAIQELSIEEDSVNVINAFGVIIDSLGIRMKPYIPSISGTIRWRLGNKNPEIRQQAAEVIGKMAMLMKRCNEEQTLATFGLSLNENLQEEYPKVLSSMIGGLFHILQALGPDKMNPPIKDLLPRLTPILRSRNERVQENCINLIGAIANTAPEHVPAKEWMRICFDLLDVLKSQRKSIRRAAIKTFGYIAKSIGPHDVLATLLSNLKVQERINRVCTTIAIAIVAENCGPFTVIPALMNEYRVPELNVQNGVLKSLSFLFEYIGEMSKDYVYAVIPLLDDALTDRDLVHRQTACSVVKHLALGLRGLGCEDALIHLLNLVWPNIFETSPHVVNAFMEAIEALRVGLGVPIIMSYLFQGLFHPARKVRNVYWKIYNNTYIGAADSMVPTYPMINDDESNCFQRNELMISL